MEKLVPVNMSNRHIHLSKEDLEALFGAGHELTKMKDLSQPGQFACEEKVDVVGPKSTIKGIRVLGPLRKETQVEISVADARALGIPGVVKASGDLAGTSGATLVGAKGEVVLSKGLMVAARHIHMDPETAGKYGVVDKEEVNVRVGLERSLIFEKVICRVNPDYVPDMHIDVEEGNAAGIKNGVMGTILK